MLFCAQDKDFLSRKEGFIDKNNNEYQFFHIKTDIHHIEYQ